MQAQHWLHQAEHTVRGGLYFGRKVMLCDGVLPQSGGYITWRRVGG